jgi:glucokinase
MADYVLGVDLGGTNIKAGLVTEDGDIVQRQSAHTPAAEGAAAVARAICQAARDCMAGAGVDARSVLGLGVGSPGTIDMENGVVLFSPNLPGWHDIPLRCMIEDDIALPCVLDNDANVAALAEQWRGAGQGASSLVLLTLGTGIGGGIVLDGRIWHGGGGVAGEIGHMSINPDGPVCGCGNHGCLEAYASATAMVRRMRESIRSGARTALASRIEELTARDIHQAAVAGDEIACQNIVATGRYLGVAVSNLMHILNPQVVAFSGGVTAAGEMLMAPLREEFRWRTLEASQHNVKVCFAALPNDAGIIGAARCFVLR